MVTAEMKLYARLHQNIVVELLETDGDINVMFHRDLVWVDASDAPGITYGWTYDGHRFSPPSCTVDPAEH
jgi:hypothetical protein